MKYQIPSEENRAPLKFIFSYDSKYLDWDIFYNSLKKARGFTYTFKALMNNEKQKHLIDLINPFRTFPNNNHLWINIEDYSDCIIRWCEEDYIMFLRDSLDNIPGVIYIVGNNKGDLKCGRSRNIKNRLRGYSRTNTDYSLLFLSETNNIVSEEKELKRIIKEFLITYKEDFIESREYFHTDHTEELINDHLPSFYINCL